MLTRIGDGDPPAYAVQVYLPQGVSLRSTLSWSDEGPAVLDPALDDAWAHGEVLKLARVLRKSPRERLTRWRG